MNEEGHRSRLHIHLGGLIIVIILALLFFKVDLRSSINSPQFQQNISYVKEQAVNVWDKYLAKPIMNGWNGLFSKLIDKGVEKIKNNVIKSSKESFKNMLNLNIKNTTNQKQTQNNFTNIGINQN